MATHHLLVAPALALAACGGGGETKPDAKIFPDYDMSCMSKPTPTTAPPLVSVYGTVQEVYAENGTPSVRPLAGASLIACRVADPDCTGGPTAVSSADGTFSIGPDTTGEVPYDAYLYVTHNGSRPSYLYPSSPLTEDNHDVPVPLLLNAFVAQLAALGISQDATKAIVGIRITDCMDLAITDTDNIVPSIKQNGVEITGLTTLNASIFSADFSGDYFFMNVPVGATEVGATYNGMKLRSHVMATVAGTTSLTKIRPGY